MLSSLSFNPSALQFVGLTNLEVSGLIVRLSAWRPMEQRQLHPKRQQLRRKKIPHLKQMVQTVIHRYLRIGNGYGPIRVGDGCGARISLEIVGIFMDGRRPWAGLNSIAVF